MEASILIDGLLALFALVFIAQLLFGSPVFGSAAESDESLSYSGFEKKSLLNQKVMRRMAWS